MTKNNIFTGKSLFYTLAKFAGKRVIAEYGIIYDGKTIKKRKSHVGTYDTVRVA